MFPKALHFPCVPQAVLFACTMIFTAALPAASAVIRFEPTGIYRHDFGPPDGAGAMEYRTSPAKTTEIVIIPPSAIPSTRMGTQINDATSPIETIDGNPGIARVITDLAVAQGGLLGNLEADGTRPPPQGFTAGPGSLSQSFSATGRWFADLGPNEQLESVALSGALRGDLRLSPALFGDASGSLSGTIRVDPFGSFSFGTGGQTGGGSFGLGVSSTGGSISLSLPPGAMSQEMITFTDLKFRPEVQANTPYTFSLTGSLSSSLSSRGVTFTAHAISNLWQQEFQLTPTVSLIPTLPPGALLASALVLLAGMRSLRHARLRRRRV